jgi:acetyl-CoA synthetase
MWQPEKDFINQTQVYKSMKKQGFDNYSDFYNWSISDKKAFWDTTVRNLGIVFKKPYINILNDQDVKNPKWLIDSELNIVDSCFQAPADQPAIVYSSENEEDIKTISYKQLEEQVNKMANSLIEQGLKKGDVIGIDMVMTPESVIVYLGAIKAGMEVVTVADSFSPNEIKVRFSIREPKIVFTQDYIYRGNKKLPLYDKVLEAGAEKVVVIAPSHSDIRIRRQDLYWESFLTKNTQFESVAMNPDDTITVLFSSGTTGNPKAIPWNQTTAIKSASDAYYHHDIQQGDVVAWPTNLGWMMGPWLIFSTLINKGTIALYEGSPLSRGFGKFVENAKVNMLGVVPSMVRAWKTDRWKDNFDWSAIKCFSSTGESSNPQDMSYLMEMGHNKPVIEYCGGTEIGGGYVTSTLIQPNFPSTFSTPALGSEFVIMDEDGKPSNKGEVFLIPPAMGLSTKLLNKNHEEVYYKGTPEFEGKILRRHGDFLVKMENGYYRVMGRTDDSMNLGGIKVSAAQIEELINSHIGVKESAAIGVSPPEGGPAQLVLFIVPKGVPDKELLQYELQKLIKFELNPLFKIHDIQIIDKMPRTASGKIMRRILRSQYKK